MIPVDTPVYIIKLSIFKIRSSFLTKILTNTSLILQLYAFLIFFTYVVILSMSHSQDMTWSLNWPGRFTREQLKNSNVMNISLQIAEGPIVTELADLRLPLLSGSLFSTPNW